MKKEQPKQPAVTDTFKLHLIELALRKLHDQLETRDDFKASPSDLIRLIEAHQSMQEGHGPNEVLVRWIERKRDSPTDAE
jgi:hypothetical protein